jgi:hypothetical protein
MHLRYYKLEKIKFEAEAINARVMH